MVMLDSSFPAGSGPPGAPAVFEPLEERVLLSADFTAWDLGTLGGTDSYSYGLNEVGQVVGTSQTGALDGAGRPASRAFLWTEGEGMVDLGTLGGDYSIAYAVNNVGEVVGISETGRFDAYGDPVTRAFYWSEPTGMVDLGTLGGRSSGAVDINDAGQVVGWAEKGNGLTRAFLWSSEGTMAGLGSLGGAGFTSIARGINADGHIVGASETGLVDDDGYITHAFLYTDAWGMQDLQTLGGDWSSAGDINAFDEVVGWADAVEPGGFLSEHAFLWDVDNGMTDVSWADGVSGAYAINDYAQVVADIEAAGGIARPYLWDAGSFTFLDEAYGLSEGADINNAGQIAGSGLVDSGTHSLLLDPALPYLTVTGGSYSEGADGTGEVDFTVELSEAWDDSVVLSYTTSDGSALWGEDYQAADGTLTFLPGETVATVSVSVFGDEVFEADERFHLQVWSPSGDAIGARGTVTVANDDDPPAPDLSAELGEVTLPARAVPGAEGKVPVILTNVGDGYAYGSADITVYMSDDFVLDVDEDVPIGWKIGKDVSLAAGDWLSANVKVSLPGGETPGSYYLLVGVDAYLDTAETDLSNNLIGLAEPNEIVWQFGNVGGERNVKLTVTDEATGRDVTFQLKGKGTGVIPDASFTEVRLTGTTSGSKLKIKPSGGGADVSVGDIVVVDGSLKAIKAPDVDLDGDLDISDGTLKKLKLDDLTAGDQLVRIGGGGRPVKMIFDELADVTIHSNSRIKKLKASEWLDTSGQADMLDAPSAKKLVIHGNGSGAEGDFEADVVLSGGRENVLKKAKIAGDLPAVSWDLRGDVKKIKGQGDLTDAQLETDGDLKKLVLGDVAGSEIRIGGGDRSVKMKLGEVSDTTIRSNASVKKLKAAEWLDAGGGTDVLHAPSVGKLVIKGNVAGAAGDFEADLALTGDPSQDQVLKKASIDGDLTGVDWDLVGNVKKIKVGGLVSGSLLRADGDLKKIVVGAITGSSVYAGVRQLPVGGHVSGPADFYDSGAVIKKLKVTGVAGQRWDVADTDFSAGQFGKIVLKNVRYDNGGDAFGFFAPARQDGRELRVVKARDTISGTKWSWKSKFQQPLVVEDLVVEIV